MKPSERILAYCAIIITVVAIAIWMKFNQAESPPIPPPPLPPTTRKINKPIPQSALQLPPPTVVEPLSEPTGLSGAKLTSRKTQTSNPPSQVPPPPPTPPTTSAPSRYDSSQNQVYSGGALVRGRALFIGDAPKPKRIKIDADPQCAAMYGGQPAFSEELIVNENGTLRNVFVYIAEGITDSYARPTTRVTLNQIGCRYDPHVFGMQVGQMLVIKNSDDTLHHIHATPYTNEEFSKGQPAGGADLKKAFLKPEVMVKLKCDIHPWMTTYVGVLAHPFFSVTGEDGSFAINGLPAGTYTLAAWHEKYGIATQQFTVTSHASRELNFEFTAP